jgi:hypothetical protein
LTDAFGAFMREIIDYAGLFPPAKLDLEPALAEYDHIRGGDHAWMLGRFIVDVPRLRELARLGREFKLRTNFPIRLCVIPRSADSAGESLDILRADAAAVRSVTSDYRDTVFVDGFEIRFPAETVKRSDYVSYLARVREIIQSADIRDVELFAEVPPTLEWRRNDTAAVEGLAAYATEFPDDPTLRRAGFKLRCGGLEAQDFPPVERIAHVIANCRDRMIPLKCTAGLHHPVRFHDPGLDTKQHGFLNVFGAGVIASALNASPAELTTCLLDETPDSFRFDGNRFHWRDLFVSTAQIERGRNGLVCAFGSCSFDEPLDDLRALGIMKI